MYLIAIDYACTWYKSLLACFTSAVKLRLLPQRIYNDNQGQILQTQGERYAKVVCDVKCVLIKYSFCKKKKKKETFLSKCLKRSGCHYQLYVLGIPESTLHFRDSIPGTNGRIFNVMCRVVLMVLVYLKVFKIFIEPSLYSFFYA